MVQTYNLETTSTSHYTGALAIGVAESESIPGLRGDGKGCIKNIILESAENLSWQIELYDKDGDVLAYKTFAVGDGYQVSGTNYRYQASDLDWAIPLTVPNTTVEIGIRNMSAQAKSASTDGAITMRLTIVKG